MARWMAVLALALLAGCAEDTQPGGDVADTESRESLDGDVPDAPEEDAAPRDDADDGLDADTSEASDVVEVSDDGGSAAPFDDMLLHADGGTLARPDGTPVDFRGAISCCGGGYGWPLFDEAWVDYAATKSVTFLHARLGPFLTGEGGESDWAAVGGGYVETGGLADLGAWNEAFWSRVRELLEYAGTRGMWVEIDILDGWAIKHCRWGDIPGYSAWDPAWNVQGEDWCATAGSREILGGDVHEQWVRKVVRETGRYGNVIYQDGNEIGLVDGYVPEWTLSIRNIVRDEEARNGYGAHLLGTNSGDAVTMQAEGVQYIEHHGEHAPDPASCYGRPCLSNEYNPRPPMTPEALFGEFCTARAAGTYFWYWRHDQPAGDMERTLTLIQGGCG